MPYLPSVQRDAASFVPGRAYPACLHGSPGRVDRRRQWSEADQE